MLSSDINAIKPSKYLIETVIGDVNKKHLLYSLRSNKLLVIDPLLYQRFKQLQVKKMTEKQLSSFIDGQFIIPSNTDELTEILGENIRNNRGSDRLYYVIQPSANCNFACDYCGQEHLDLSMSDKTINNTVNLIKSQLDQSKKEELYIGWFGAEPLLALDRMRCLNLAIKEKIKHSSIKKYGGKIVTNGYFLNEAIYKELVLNFNIDRIEITLDGDRDSHDERRIEKKKITSFDKIYTALKSIVKSDFYNDNIDKCIISIRCNVDERNYLNVSNLLDILKKDNIHDKILFYIAQIRDWGDNDASSKSLSTKRFSSLLLDMKVKMINLGFNVNSLLPKRNYGICSSIGGGMKMVDALGKVWACTETSLSKKYEKSQFYLGNVNTNKTFIENNMLSMYYDSIKDPICKECTLLPICGTGCPKAMDEGKKRCYYSKTNIMEYMKVQATYNLLKESNI